MKKTETKISSVRAINDPALSVVKIKRHPKPKPNKNKVNFIVPSVSITSNAFSLPVAIPEEGLKELEIPPKIQTKPMFYKPLKKIQTSKDIPQPMKSSRKIKDEAESNADTTSEYIYKLTSDIQAIENKLSKVEGVLSKKIETASSLQKSQINTVEFKADPPQDQKTYNASDYADDLNTVTGYPSYYNRNSYSSELQKCFINPLKKSLPLPQQYPIDFDSKAAVNAIRNELEEWKKVNKTKYVTLPNISMPKNEVSSCDLQISTSEENTVSRDVAEKDTSSLDSRNKFQDQPFLNKQSLTLGSKAVNFPLDHYLELQKNKNEYKLLKEPGKKSESKSQNLIKQINDLATEAEEKVKACIYEEAIRPSPSYSPISLNESDSGYTEHLVEKKFNEVTFQKPKGENKRLPPNQREEQLNSVRIPIYNKPNYNPIKYGREIFRSTADTLPSSPMSTKPINQKKIDKAFEKTKSNQYHFLKSPTVTSSEHKQPKVQILKKKSSNPTTHHCSCKKGIESESDLKNSSNKELHLNFKDKLPANNSHEKIDGYNLKKQYTDASINTEPLSLRLNTHLINVVSSHEQKSIQINNCVSKLCQIQELPKVVIRPNFTKQVGPVIDIKTSKHSSQKSSNVAVVECVHGGTTFEKGNDSVSTEHEPEMDTASQIVSPPAVHFKNSRDLKLLKVTKDLLGKLNFKDGANVAKLKRSLTNLVSLLNQISPIHVADLRLTSLDTVSASESIDTFFSNIDLVTEIIENEIVKPTGRYCDYPECLIKAVDLLCGNIRSVFVIEDCRKRIVKPEVSGLGEEKRKVKKTSLVKNRKSLSTKKNHIAERPQLVPSTITEYDKESSCLNPPDMYIPYRMLIPGGKHKAMEEAKNSRDIELRFKRLEKVLEINQSLKQAVPSQENSQSDKSSQSKIEQENSSSKGDHNVLNETFIIKSASDDSDDDANSEIRQKKLETKSNKSEPDYEDDWEVDSSKTNGGSMTMTEVIVAAQVHSSELQTSFAHSSPKKLPLSDKLSQAMAVSTKGSQTENLGFSSYSSTVCQSPVKMTEVKDPKQQNEKHLIKNQIHGGLKDIETVNKRDIATMYCEDIQNQTSKVQVIDPIPTPVDVPSFPFLRLTDHSTKSQLEVRFPKQADKLKSSITVQKSNVGEEIKLSYDIDTGQNILSGKGLSINETGCILPQNTTEKKDSLQCDPSTTEMHPPGCAYNTDLYSTKKTEVNEFQNITTNFIQFLETKVAEMVGKFKLSEGTCEKLLDQKLMNQLEHKTSQTLNKYQVSSSKTSLKNENFYKSASSLFSNQSHEYAPGVTDFLSQRCTPENQETIPYENLTSPPLGLQLKESSNLNKTINLPPNTLYDSQNKDRKPNSIENLSIKLIPNSNALGKDSQSQISSDNLENINDKLTGNEIREQARFILKEDKENRNPNGIHNRLLPLPEDVISSNTVQSSNDEKEKIDFSTISQKLLSSKNSIKVDESNIDCTVVEEMLQASSKNNERKTSQHLEFIPQSKSAIFEETMLALMSVEHTFENIEESTVVFAKTPQISSRNEDDLESQRTSVSQLANILSASDSGKVSSIPSNRKHPSPPITQSYEKVCSWSKESNENTSIEVKTNHQEQDSLNILHDISTDRNFSKLLPAPEPINEHQPDRKYFEDESQPDAAVSVHSLFISGPSHIDVGLDCSDSIFKNSMGNVEKKLADHSSQVPSTPNDNVPQAVRNELLSISSQTSPPPPKDTAVQTTNTLPLRTSPPNDETVETTVNTPLNTDSSDLSDDCTHLNYYNPEEMSDGEVGYVYTSNSYSSGEIKPFYEQTDDDSFSGPPTFRETAYKLPNHPSNYLKSSDDTLKHKTQVKDSFLEASSSNAQNKPQKMDTFKESEKVKENTPEVEIFSSSNDSTSTGELKDLFTSEDKIDEGLLGKLIDIHIRCSNRFSSESSGHIESVESVENKDEDI